MKLLQTQRLILVAALLWGCSASDEDAPPAQDASETRQKSDTTPDGSTDGKETSVPETQCQFTDDGTCDEPVNCALGSDESDCANACTNQETYWLHAAACAFRSPVDKRLKLSKAQSPGDLQATGYFDRTVNVALGDGSGSRPRHYRVYVPPQYDPSLAWPLVIMMPGHRVDIYSLANYTRLEATAEANNFILVYAEQEWRKQSLRWAWWTDWNWKQKPTGNPDVPFLRDLVSDVASRWSIDRQKIYGVGHSRGGAMAYIGAFELADLFAAVCSQSGFTEFGYSDHVVGWKGRKTPVMLVHGTKDTDVPVKASDAMNKQLKTLGWTPDILVYQRLENVAHRWQPWLNQTMWDFLNSHTHPDISAGPLPQQPTEPATSFGRSPAVKTPVAPALDQSNMASFPASDFEMGWPDSKVGPYGDAWYVDQQPARTVKLSPFHLDKTEVSVAEFALFLSHAGGDMFSHPSQPIERVKHGYRAIEGQEDIPINHVTWSAAHNYCRWVGKRLPTEAEFEFAVRGSTPRVFPWPEGGLNCQRANYFTGATHCQGKPVAVFHHSDGASPEQILNLVGNVAEWVADDYGPYNANYVDDPLVSNGSGHKVVRGGGWMDPPQALRGHSRRAVARSAHSANIGFRCAWANGATFEANRGDLVTPEDLDRIAHNGPVTPPTSSPTVLLSGLTSPQGLVRFGNAWIVANTGAGELWSLADGAAEPQQIAKDLGEPTVLRATPKAVLGLDIAQSRVFQWDESTGSLSDVATLPGTPVDLAVDDTYIFAASESNVYNVSDTPMKAIVSDLDGVSSIQLRNGLLYVAILGSKNIKEAKVIQLTATGEKPAIVVSQNTLQGVLHVPGVTWEQDTKQLVFPLVRAGWPFSGVIGRVSTSGNKLNVGTHGPPGMKHLLSTAKGLVVGCKNTLIRANAGQPYTVVAPWTSASALAADNNGNVIWLDRQAGRLLRAQ